MGWGESPAAFLHTLYTALMLKVSGNEVLRDSVVVGYIDGIYIKGRDYKNIGYFQDNYIYDALGKKLAYINGDYLYDYANPKSYTDLGKVKKAFKDDGLPEIARSAIYQLIGA